jgi:hypothetical protein
VTFWWRLFAYIGNRGIVLSMLGVIWTVTAIGLYVDPYKRPGLPDDILPIPVRIALWAVAGVVAVVATWWRRLDEYAWGLLIVAPSMRLLSYGYGWIFGTFPPGWRSVLVYAATVLLVNRCAAGLDRPAPWDRRERRKWTPQQ